MNEKLVIAIPSKGRLKSDTQDILAQAGHKVGSPFGERNYRGIIEGDAAIEVAFLSASEIARETAKGTVHLGVTGEDIVKESIADHETILTQITPLGFGHADVVVAVPDCWIDVNSMEDLDDVAASFRQNHGRRLRIATKYQNLTQRFFKEHGIAVYRIVQSLGATEGAPAAGLADAIVDITSTGGTLKANYLKTLDDGIMLRSQANLFASKAARWTNNQKESAAHLIKQLAANLQKTHHDTHVRSEAAKADDKFSTLC